MLDVFVICYNCCFVVFSHFGLCNRTKSRLIDAAFEMQVSFCVGDSWNRHPSLISSKTYETYPWKNKTKVCLFLFILLETEFMKLMQTWKTYGTGWCISFSYVLLKNSKLKRQSYNAADVRIILCLNICKDTETSECHRLVFFIWWNLLKSNKTLPKNRSV